RAAAEGDRPREKLHDREHQHRGADQLPRHEIVEIVVADAERARRVVADDADRQSADRRPPHPMNRQVLEQIFDPVHRARHVYRQPSHQRADDDSGLRSVTRAGILPSFNNTCSIASGIPCPRMAFDPKRAISPTITPPMTGMTKTKDPTWLCAGETKCVETRP